MFKETLKSIVDSIILTEAFFIRPEKKPGDEKKKVLILRKDGLGDCIVFYPTLKAYREYYKGADITLVFPKYFESLAPIVGKDLVNKVIWFDHKAFSGDFWYRRKFLLDLSRKGYDVAIYPVFSRESIGDKMIWMTCAKERIGFDGDPSVQGKEAKAKGNATYTRLIDPPPQMRLEIERDRYFAEQVTGMRCDIEFPTFDTKKLPCAKADSILSGCGVAGKRFAVIFPGAGAPYRIWPAERWAKAIDHISAKGIAPLICGSDKDARLAQKISSLATSKAFDITGKTDLADLAHILTKASFYFGSDTGILHLAVAVKTPAAAIVGSGGLWRFFPYGDPETNLAIYDKSRPYGSGVWTDAKELKPGQIHPSIAAIAVKEAECAIDRLIGVIG